MTESKPVNVAMLTPEELEKIVTEAAIKGAAIVADNMARDQEEKTKRQRRRRLHNTRLLLKNYQMMKENCEEAVYRRTMAQKTNYELIESLMSGRDDSDEMVIASIRESAERTAVILTHIDKMIAIFRDYCSKSGDRERRQYRVIRGSYLQKTRKTIAELADEFDVTERTIQKDREIGEERLSVLFFGIDGLRF